MKLHLNPTPLLHKLWQRYATPAFLCMVGCIAMSVHSFVPYDNTAASQPFRDALEIVFTVAMLGVAPATFVCTLRSRMKHTPLLAWIIGIGSGIALHLLNNDDLSTAITAASLLMCFWGAAGKAAPVVRLNQIAGWFCASLGLSIVLYAAGSVLAAAVLALFFPDASWTISDGICATVALCAFLWFAPWMFLGGLPDEDTPVDKRQRFRKFNARVLLPAALLLMAILLVYVSKIVLAWEMPVGTMNGYALAALMLFTCFHLTLTGDENVLARFFVKWCGWLMLPILAAQQVGVWIRVEAYGLTESRILGIALTLLCAGVVVTALLRKRAAWFLPAAAIATIVLLASPISAANIALKHQEARLEAALIRNNMLAEDGSIVANPEANMSDRRIMYDAGEYLFQYLNKTPEGNLSAQLRDQLTDDYYGVAVNSSKSWYELFGFTRPSDSETTTTTWNFNGSANQSRLSVKGFDYAQWLYLSRTSKADDNGENRITGDPIGLWEYLCTIETPDVIPEGYVTAVFGEEIVDFASVLSGFTETTAAYATGSTRTFTLANDRLTLPSGKVFHIDLFQVYYSTYSDYVSISMQGWLLTPEAE